MICKSDNWPNYFPSFHPSIVQLSSSLIPLHISSVLTRVVSLPFLYASVLKLNQYVHGKHKQSPGTQHWGAAKSHVITSKSSLITTVYQLESDGERQLWQCSEPVCELNSSNEPDLPPNVSHTHTSGSYQVLNWGKYKSKPGFYSLWNQL